MLSHNAQKEKYKLIAEVVARKLRALAEEAAREQASRFACAHGATIATPGSGSAGFAQPNVKETGLAGASQVTTSAAWAT